MKQTAAVIARYYATGTWKARTALHLGGEAGDLEANSDMALLRGADGRYFIPGGSVAGAARSHLARTYAGSRSLLGWNAEPLVIKVLFGGSLGTREYASLLTTLDAPNLRGAAPEVRDGVAISPETGIAMDKFKYDFEVLASGAEFQVCLLLTIYDKPLDGIAEPDLKKAFLELLAGFADGSIRLGARTRRGLGRGAVENWTVRRLDMNLPDHVEAWLSRDWKQAPPFAYRGEPLEIPVQPRPSAIERLAIDARLRLRTSLLIRSASPEPAAPDMVHLRDNGVPVLSGSGLAGALRSRCERIARTAGLGDAAALVDRMFGPRNRGQATVLRASRAQVEEFGLESGTLQVQGRVAIDRFTGGALEAALFDEAPFWPDNGGSHVRARLYFDLDRAEKQDDEEPKIAARDPREPALLLQAFKDLWLGDLPLGGEIGGGRGVITGMEATFSYPSLVDLKISAPDPDNPAHVEVTSGDWQKWNSLGSALGGEDHV